MTRVSVRGSVIRWAIERSGKASAIRNTFPQTAAWETGTAQPTLRQLESFAKETSTPLGYLFLSAPPEERLPIPDFRTHDDRPVHRPSPDLLETVYLMQRRQDWLRDFLEQQGEDPLPFVGSARSADPPEEVARKMRDVLGLSCRWAAGCRTWTDALAQLRRTIEDRGVVVVVNGIVGNNTHRKLDPNEFRGFVLVDEHAPLVFINGADSKAAQMFTLMHELAHVWLGKSAAFDLRELEPSHEPSEQACNRIAAEFLVPKQELTEFWSRAKEEADPIQTVAREFKVSALVAARRARDLKLVRPADFSRFYRRYEEGERQKRKAPRGGDFYATQNLRLGRPFGEAVVRAVKEGKLSYSEAYRLTGLYGTAFHRYSAQLHGRTDA
ncbi:MAG: ImmA/IrrE family metallo-endopeptidase [Candidatus Methylacidiphilaceae bacterium]